MNHREEEPVYSVANILDIKNADDFARHNLIIAHSGETLLTLLMKKKLDDAFMKFGTFQESDYWDAISICLEYTEDANQHNEDGNSPMFIAAALGKHDEIRVLLEHGADVNVRTVHKTYGDTRFGQVPLTIAAICGYSKVIDRLLKAGADTKETLDDHMISEDSRKAIMEYALNEKYKDENEKAVNPSPPYKRF